MCVNLLHQQFDVIYFSPYDKLSELVKVYSKYYHLQQPMSKIKLL